MQEYLMYLLGLETVIFDVNGATQISLLMKK
jgi:hypothetical protein